MRAHQVVVALLSDADLQRWRTWYARDCALNVVAGHYSRDEVEQHYRDKMVLISEFIQRYEFMDSPLLAISELTGIVYYEDSD